MSEGAVTEVLLPPEQQVPSRRWRMCVNDVEWVDEDEGELLISKWANTVIRFSIILCSTLNVVLYCIIVDCLHMHNPTSAEPMCQTIRALRSPFPRSFLLSHLLQAHRLTLTSVPASSLSTLWMFTFRTYRQHCSTAPIQSAHQVSSIEKWTNFGCECFVTIAVTLTLTKMAELCISPNLKSCICLWRLKFTTGKLKFLLLVDLWS